jgi:hypothetical protein
VASALHGALPRRHGADRLPGDDRQSFDEQRRGQAAFGKVKTVRGLGKAAYLSTDDPAASQWDLHVFCPSKRIPGPPVAGGNGGTGAFDIHPVVSGLTVQSEASSHWRGPF